MSFQALLWIGFNVFVAIMLLLDLLVFNRKSHSMRIREALAWTGFWVLLAVAFNGFIYYIYPIVPGGMGKEEAALQFLTGYLIEQSLSVDNLFVFLMLFTFFRTPTAFQRKVLFWGIIGAVFFRSIFILTGFELLDRFPIISLALGAILIITAVRMLFNQDKEIHPEKNIVSRMFGKIMPVSPYYDGAKFFTSENGKKMATPLFIVLIVVETTDIVFALDSIPAVLAITKDPFIAYSSNIFAILGLRALYFALAGIMELFHYLHYGLALILIFVGAKIILANILGHELVSVWVSLAIVGSVLGLSILLSLLLSKKDNMPVHHTPGDAKKKPF